MGLRKVERFGQVYQIDDEKKIVYRESAHIDPRTGAPHLLYASSNPEVFDRYEHEDKQKAEKEAEIAAKLAAEGSPEPAPIEPIEPIEPPMLVPGYVEPAAPEFVFDHQPAGELPSYENYAKDAEDKSEDE